MPVSIEVTGADEFDKAARALGAADDELRREMDKRLDRVAHAIVADVKAEPVKRLPRRGGLGRRVAHSKIEAKRSPSRNPGFTVTADGGQELGLMDEGTVRKPVFGNRDVWVEQKITGGWFSEPVSDHRDDVKRELDHALDDVAHHIARKVD